MPYTFASKLSSSDIIGSLGRNLERLPELRRRASTPPAPACYLEAVRTKPRGKLQLRARKDAKLDVAKALLLRMRGVDRRVIAKLYDVSPAAVSAALAPFSAFLTPRSTKHGALEAWQANEADLLDLVRVELLRNMLDKARLGKASVNNLAFAFTQLNLAGRLKRGETTANLGLRASVIVGAHRKLRASDNVQLCQPEGSASLEGCEGTVPAALASPRTSIKPGAPRDLEEAATAPAPMGVGDLEPPGAGDVLDLEPPAPTSRPSTRRKRADQARARRRGRK